MINSEYRDIIYPCNLGIKFSSDYSESLTENLKKFINLAFDSFFYNIFVNKWSLKQHYLINLGREENIQKNEQFNETVILYPTNIFYASLKLIQNFHRYSTLRLGITNLPLYSSTKKNLIFLYGEAHINQKCAVVSTYNLRDIEMNLQIEPPIVEERIIKECIHELGHLILGNNHCNNSYCVMNYSNNLQKVDEKSIFPCNSCDEKLEEIRENYNF